MSIVSVSAEVHCDGKNCDATSISYDVSTYTVNTFGHECAEILVYAQTIGNL